MLLYGGLYGLYEVAMGSVRPIGSLCGRIGLYGVSMEQNRALWGLYGAECDSMGSLWGIIGLYGFSMGQNGVLWGLYGAEWGSMSSLWGL